MSSDNTLPDFNPDPALPRRLLEECAGYAPTPIRVLTGPSGGELWVKDETGRMGLGAFKAVGGIYAVARLIEDAWCAKGNAPLEKHEFARFDVREMASGMTFVTASAGNHGMAVAAGARIFGAKARIFLAKDVPQEFEDRLIETQGAEVVRAGDTYEQSVATATRDAETRGAILLADGSWPGYVRPPSFIMEGYTVIAEEMREHFEVENTWPSHVFLQAGVGGIAGAATHMIRETWAEQPKIIIVEPDAAPCLEQSVAAGKAVTVEGPASNMGRLDCKDPSIIALGIMLKSNVEFQLISDEQAQRAADWLGTQGLATTPSGAAGLAALEAYGPCERPLIIVTEGSL